MVHPVGRKVRRLRTAAEREQRIDSFGGAEITAKNTPLRESVKFKKLSSGIEPPTSALPRRRSTD